MYIDDFGRLPEFKAGVHGGKVMAAEVGTVKKKIAYHGDVLNTTARIQDQCNAFQQKLLVSKALLNELVLNSSKTTINVSNLPKGVYFLTVTTDQGQRTKRFIVQ